MSKYTHQPPRKQLEVLEGEIQELESEKENLEMMRADPELYKRGEEAKHASQRYNELLPLLELKYSEWTSKTDEIAKVEKSGELPS